MNRIRVLCAAILAAGILFAAGSAAAQTPSQPSREELLKRVQHLEAQLAELRSELAAVREQLSTLAPNAADPPAREALATNPQPAPVQAASGMKEPGIALGPWRAVPYGTLFFNAFGNSSGVNNTDVPTFAAVGSSGVSASGRQTRLGLRLAGPEIGGAKLSTVFEADFFGGFPPIGVGEDFSIVRMRLAYAQLRWEHSSLLIGQDWLIFAPGNPVSIASAAIPQMTSAGNLWARLPQIRLELSGGSTVKWLWQSAVLAPATGDFPANVSAFLLQPGAGARSRVPYFEARAALVREDWFGLGHPATLGVSTHYGRARTVTSLGNRDSDSVGVALDWDLPLVPRVTLAGEAFFGRNLAGLQGAVFQGINSDFAYRTPAGLVAGGPRAIGTRGGWAQLGFTPPRADKLTFYSSFGLDDPRDKDLVSLTTHDWRLRNESFAFSLIHRPSPQFSWGAEFRRLLTDYLLSGKRADNHVNLGVTVSF